MPDISELLTTAPIALILLAYIYLSDKQRNKLIESLNKTTDKLIDLLKDFKR